MLQEPSVVTFASTLAGKLSCSAFIHVLLSFMLVACCMCATGIILLVLVFSSLSGNSHFGI